MGLAMVGQALDAPSGVLRFPSLAGVERTVAARGGPRRLRASRLGGELATDRGGAGISGPLEGIHASPLKPRNERNLRAFDFGCLKIGDRDKMKPSFPL